EVAGIMAQDKGRCRMAVLMRRYPQANALMHNFGNVSARLRGRAMTPLAREQPILPMRGAKMRSEHVDEPIDQSAGCKAEWKGKIDPVFNVIMREGEHIGCPITTRPDEIGPDPDRHEIAKADRGTGEDQDLNSPGRMDGCLAR